MIDMFYENAEHPGVPRGTWRSVGDVDEHHQDFALDAWVPFDDLSPAASSVGVPDARAYPAQIETI